MTKLDFTSGPEVADASEALMRWFVSQDITPATAGVVMANVIASDLAGLTPNGADAYEGLDIYMKMLKQMLDYKLKGSEKT